MRLVLGDHGGIHHQKILPVTQAIDDQVINHPALVIEHQGVLTVADSQLAHIVGQSPVEKVLSPGSFDQELAHVGDVKDPHLLPHRLVLIHDARVLHRHLPSGKGHHAGGQLQMGLMERGTIQRGFGHRRPIWRPTLPCQTLRIGLASPVLGRT